MSNDEIVERLWAKREERRQREGRRQEAEARTHTAIASWPCVECISDEEINLLVGRTVDDEDMHPVATVIAVRRHSAHSIEITLEEIGDPTWNPEILEDLARIVIERHCFE